MKKRVLGMLACLTLLALNVPAAMAETAASAGDLVGETAGERVIPLRVMTYNIRFGKGWDEQWDLKRTVSVIRTANPDIIGLQEVDREWSSRSEFTDVVTELAYELGMFYTFSTAMDKAPGFPGGKFGNAVLSRYPILEVVNRGLPGAGMGRSIAGVKILLEDVPVNFFTTHLGLSVEDRRLQMAKILQLLEEAAGPVIITGDWNATADAEEVQAIAEWFLDVQAVVGKEHLGTFLSKNSLERPRIDYIFVSPEFGVDKVEIIETMASDHLPVVADLTLRVTEGGD
ncbi:MAG TPA: endonuclease/exonuclease/phosphatase [Firmicutes bacterium]|jgi:endonuclease/exonuclease/phosphatase family metal-dependent hydrolase|nr:endonuclease/exonuclease/phosphatase [Bacillota bacterium]HOQ25015.1 endonuclease/exonuclease/phosphatase family protein [Bacillota bacterium]HPT66856.1 endonuclease/exonuclease/phosphatase family protein [Bacillota bacterium]